MTDRPILFSAPMILALLAGRKTQTRRIIRPQPPAGFNRHCWFEAPVYGWTNEPCPSSRWHLARLLAQRGDRLWCREAWRTSYNDDWFDHDLGRVPRPSDLNPKTTAIEYLADGTHELGGRIRQSMFMPRWASRLTLAVEDVRVERINDISREDAIAEGLQQLPATKRYVVEKGEQYLGFAHHDPRVVYSFLWNRINGDDAWDRNDWVAAYTFTVHHTNIDAMKEAA